MKENKKTISVGDIDRDMINHFVECVNKAQEASNIAAAELKRIEGLRDYYIAGLAQKGGLTGELNYDHATGKITGDIADSSKENSRDTPDIQGPPDQIDAQGAQGRKPITEENESI